MTDPIESNKTPAKEFIILGLTQDWAERLCGVMSRFRPPGTAGRHAHLQYSPYVFPTLIDGVRSVAVNGALRDLEPLAYHFVVNFAKDNNLQIVDVCILPDEGAGKP
jgi:hypothetical protein